MIITLTNNLIRTINIKIIRLQQNKLQNSAVGGLDEEENEARQLRRPLDPTEAFGSNGNGDSSLGSGALHPAATAVVKRRQG